MGGPGAVAAHTAHPQFDRDANRESLHNDVQRAEILLVSRGEFRRERLHVVASKQLRKTGLGKLVQLPVRDAELRFASENNHVESTEVFYVQKVWILLANLRHINFQLLRRGRLLHE